MINELLRFDSLLAHRRIAECSLTDSETIDDALMAGFAGYDLVYLKSKIRPDINILLKNFHWILADIKIELSGNINEINYISQAPVKEDLFNEGDVEELVRLGKDLYKASRFYFDPNTKKLGQKIYEEWIKNSINKTLADEILVCRNKQSRLIGFVTVKKYPEYVEPVLAKVDSRYLGKGYGKLLMNKFFNYIQQNYPNVKVVAHTQIKNAINLKLQQSFGLKVTDYIFVYHVYPKGFLKFN